MILDSLSNIGNYAMMHPLFAQAVDFLLHTDLDSLPLGKIVLVPDQLFVNVNQTSPKSVDEAKLETHKAFIDIQVPLSGPETMGYTAADQLSEAPYDESSDISFYSGKALDYFTVRPGQFAIFFPSDGHAPGITPMGVKKIIVKVRI